MSILSKDSLQVVAGSLGITLRDDTASGLISDMEYRLRDIICPVYGWFSKRNSRFVSSWKTFKSLYYLDDPKVCLETIMNEPLPPVPLDVTYTAHWLAVEGVQPAIPQNFNPKEVKERLKHFTKLPDSSSNFKPVSREIQLYYKKVVEAILGNSNELKKLALESVCQDFTIQYLAPYFVQLATDQILRNMDNIKIATSMLRLIRALLVNPNLSIESYLHEIIPDVLTCLVAKRLCKDPSEDHWQLRIYASKLMAFICKKYGTVYSTLQNRVTKTLLHALLGPEKELTTNFGAIVGIKALGPEAVRLLLIPSLSEFTRKLEKFLTPNRAEFRGNNLEQSNPEQGNLEQGNPEQGNLEQGNPKQDNPEQSNPEQINPRNPEEYAAALKCHEAIVDALTVYYKFTEPLSKNTNYQELERELNTKYPLFSNALVKNLIPQGGAEKADQ